MLILSLNLFSRKGPVLDLLIDFQPLLSPTNNNKKKSTKPPCPGNLETRPPGVNVILLAPIKSCRLPPVATLRQWEKRGSGAAFHAAAAKSKHL